MGRKSATAFETKLLAIEAYDRGEGSIKTISERFNINKSNFIRWLTIYRSQGADGLIPSQINKGWNKDIKILAVQDYLSGKGSMNDICQKYKISSDSILRRWIKVYNDSHKELKTTGLGGRKPMTKARKTTFEERIEIVQFCIANSKNYSLTMDKFSVSYQQIYLWVRKYETKGVDGLIDRRGKVKPKSDITEVDRLKAEYKLLEAKNKQLEMEVNVLKKLAEVERRRR